MPVSPQQVEEFTYQKYNLCELYDDLDRRLKASGVIVCSTLSTKHLPDFIAEQVADAYRAVGWDVTWQSFYDRDGSLTSFVFIKK